MHLKAISRTWKFLTSEATEKVLHAFVSSRLACCNSILYWLPNYQIYRLHLIQTTAARILTHTRKFEQFTPILHFLHWLSIANRIELKSWHSPTSTFIHKQAPTYLSDLIKLHQPGCNFRSADKLLLHVPKTRLKKTGLFHQWPQNCGMHFHTTLELLTI